LVTNSQQTHSHSRLNLPMSFRKAVSSQMELLSSTSYHLQLVSTDSHKTSFLCSTTAAITAQQWPLFTALLPSSGSSRRCFLPALGACYDTYTKMA
jgi:hypothetical protein